MKTNFKVLLTVLSLTGLYACTKNQDAAPNTNPTNTTTTTTTTTTNSTVFYVDTFRVYSTTLTGTDRKVVVDEDLKSNNNYISSISTLPGKSMLVYSYSTGYLNPVVIKTVGNDGTGLKTIKTIPAGTYIYFLKGVTGGKIYYSTGVSAATAKIYVMDADGTNEKEITGIPSGEVGTYIPEQQIAGQGTGVLGNDGYFIGLASAAFNEAGSFSLLTNETKASIVRMAISDDGTKAALLYKTAIANVFEVRVKDITKTNTAATLVYTVTLDADESLYNIYMLWANGTKNIIVYDGKFTTPKGSVSDYTKCELVDISAKTATNWKFTGDQISQIVVN
jgi:hypothetical protein